jgi:arylsulfatase A-like enzyme
MSPAPDVSRRQILRAAALGPLALAAGAGRLFGQTAARLPNIVFIMADDLGYADIACYGRPDIRTPNIDRLAARGVRFMQAYANSAVCSATRTALITGRYQYRLPVGLEEPIAATDPRGIGLPAEIPTLPSLLKKAGYSTMLVGKWHLGRLPAYGPLKSGYDHFYGFRSGGVDYYRHTDVTQKDDLWDDDVNVRQAGYLTDLLGDRTVDVVNGFAKAGRPFFLSLHFSAPHWPWEAPGDEAEAERIKATNLRHWDGGTQQTYQRMVEAMDRQVGRLMTALDANGLTDNTIVVFTSDNGGERFADTWPFTGRKTELLEGGLRIPAILSWPARVLERVSHSDDLGDAGVVHVGAVVGPGKQSRSFSDSVRRRGPDERRPLVGLDVLGEVLDGSHRVTHERIHDRVGALQQRFVQDRATPALVRRDP